MSKSAAARVESNGLLMGTLGHFDIASAAKADYTHEQHQPGMDLIRNLTNLESLLESGRANRPDEPSAVDQPQNRLGRDASPYPMRGSQTGSEARSVSRGARPGARAARTGARWASLALAAGFALSAQAAIQFDVFLGYGGQPTGADGIVREANWFSVACEVHNDGPSFNTVFELSPTQSGGAQTRQFAVELPTNTRKRFVIPVFVGTGQYLAWDARLLDGRGRIRAEKLGLRPRSLAWETLLLGAVPRTFAGLPKLPELKGENKRSTAQPLVARLPVEQLPDNPLALEGLDALYLNSEKASELKEPQADALQTWVHSGGHLIVAIEQPSDLNAAPWLQSLLPCVLRETATRKPTRELEQWLVSRRSEGATTESPRRTGPGGVIAKYQPPGSRPARASAEEESPMPDVTLDSEFLGTEFAVATGRLRDGQALLSVQDTPLIIRGARGRGLVTVLTFSPEREPFRSWKQREWFWARLLEVPAGWFVSQPLNPYGGSSLDGVFGAMIDSRQVHAMPVLWLLLLLAVYLVVIGPLDQYWLKKINRQMLTWLTFPAYVVIFSLLIYYIGYRLRAGETEWNELHLVDLLPRGAQADWRGRTYASIYSPVNESYRLASALPRATVRGEFLGMWGAGQEGGRLAVTQLGEGFNAEMFVPVWTSQLLASDWVQTDTPPLSASLMPQGPNLKVRVRNELDRPLTDLRLAWRDQIFALGEVKAKSAAEFTLDREKGELLAPFVQRHAGNWQTIVQQRQHAFGSDQSRWLALDSTNVTAATFVGQLPGLGNNQRLFVHPAGLELSSLVERDNAVLLAWDAGHAPVPSMKRFKSVRSQQNTMYRLAIPLDAGGAN